MNDPDIEALLRRYRPVGPSEALRARVLGMALAPARRVWPWAAAAALLLASTLALELGVDRETVRADLALPSDPAARVADDLTDLLGDDPPARRFAELLLVEQRLRGEMWSPAPDPGAAGEGAWR